MPLETNYATIDETARKRFEAAWRQGRPRDWTDFLPAVADPRRLATLEEFVQIDLELAWKHSPAEDDGSTHSLIGGRAGPLLEQYLSTYPELSATEVLLRLIKQEHLVRRRAGYRPHPDDYASRFPQLADHVAQAGGWQLVLGVSDERPVPFAREDESKPGRTVVATDHEIRGVIGRGGMGIVYEAHEPTLGRTVALKTIRSGQDASPHDRERFLQEARIPARLEHPGIVPVHELICPEQGEPYYTMKLVQGRTLLEAIHECHELPAASTARELARHRLLTSYLAVVRTMAFAHSRGVIHRDLKPANVVLGNFGETVILDWGLAKVMGERSGVAVDSVLARAANSAETVCGTVLGTPAYMPPEQAAGQIEKVDERSDVYALGAILYQILTNRAPASHLMTVATVAAGETSSPIKQRLSERGLPRQLVATCLRAMEADPAQRYPTAEALAGDVERFLAGEPVSVCPERASERLARWSRKHRTLMTTASVATILLLIGGALGYAQIVRHRLEQETAAKEAEQERKQLQREKETESKQLQREKELELASAAKQNEILGLAETQAGRFESAALIFAAGANRLREVPALAEDFQRISARERRVRKLATFYSLWGHAERISSYTLGIQTSRLDQEVIAACREGLSELHALGGDGRWWEHLPADELTQSQRRQLEDEVGSALGLLALWQVKQYLSRFFLDKNAPVPPAPDFSEVRKWMASIREYNASHGIAPAISVEALDRFCRLMTGDLSAALQTPKFEVNGSKDAFYIGVTYLFLTQRWEGELSTLQAKSNTLFGILPSSAQPSLSLFPGFNMNTLLGIDATNPREKAGRYLRSAVSLDPDNYWAHYWLAHQLEGADDLPAAEQSFNACVGLRPHYAVGYIGRSRVQIAQIIALNARLASGKLTKDEENSFRSDLTDLKQRSVEGLLIGIESQPHDAALFWSRTLARAWAEKFPEALADLDRAATLEAARFLVEQRRGDDGVGIARIALAYMDSWKFPEVYNQTTGARALLNLTLGNRDAARSLTDGVLKAYPNYLPGVAVRGALHLGDEKWSEALSDFHSVAREQPDNLLAALGVALAQESAGNMQAALEAYDRLAAQDSPTEPRYDWRELAIHLGRARTLAALQRRGEAEQALERARAINPLSASETQAKIFPDVTKP